MTSRAAIRIAYDGPEITGAMDVRQLAPALFDLGQLIEEANRVLNGDACKVRVLVKADFQPGSFQVNLEMAQNFVDAVKGWLELGTGADALDLKYALGFASTSVSGGLGLVGLVKWLRGKVVKEAKPLPNGGNEVHVEGDNNTVVVVNGVMPLYDDPAVRKALHSALKPLEDPDIERVIFREDAIDVEVIERDEMPYFSPPETDGKDEGLVDGEFTARYQLVTPQFAPGLKWRFSDGQTRIPADMEDKEFMQRVANGDISFTCGDTLEVRMRIVQSMSGEVLHTDYKVVEVKKHHPKATHVQLSFPAEADAEEG